MMHSQVKKVKFALFLALVLSALTLQGCTSAQDSGSIDDEMMAETSSAEVGDPSLMDSEPAGEEELSLDDFDSAESTPPPAASEGDLELDFEDFDQAAPAEAMAENEAAVEQDLAAELDLDDLQAEDVVQTPEPPPIDTQAEVESAPLEEDWDLDAPMEAEGSASTPMAVSPKATEITDIRYLSNQSGGSVVIEAQSALTHQSRFNSQNGQFVIEVENAILPERLKRPYLMKDFTGSIGSVNAYQVPGESSVRVVVQLKPGVNSEPTLQVEGNSLVVVPPSTPLVAQNGSGNSAPRATPEGPLSADSLESLSGNDQKFYGKPISLQVRDADIRDVLGFVAEESGANIVIADNVNGKISLKLRQIPWDQALVSIMKTKNLGYIRQGNVIRVTTMKDLQEETETARLMAKAKKEMAPVKVKVLPINYASVEALETQIKNFLTPEGKVVADIRSNSLLITDREDILDKVSKIIAALDVQPNQVLIEGKIVEAVENFVSEVGVNWGANGAPVTLSQTGGHLGTPLQLTPNMAVGRGSSTLANVFGFRIGRLDFLGDLTAALRLAESESAAKVISSPRVVAMNKQKAEIAQVGEQISIVSTRDPQTNETTKSEKRTKINLRLTVTPQITTDGSIIMDMDVIREFAGAEVDVETKARPINSRAAKTTVLVRNGQTAVIGGIYQMDDTEIEEGVPVLKDIPVLGWLFKSKIKSRDKNELLIFLTPRILLESNEQTAASL